jgi:DNA topoisomerase-1
MRQLIHHGVYVPEYKPIGLSVKYNGKRIELDAEAEQMALAFVKKFNTTYIKDSVFVNNFLEDFCRKVGIDKVDNLNEIDWSEIEDYVVKEKKLKENMSGEERRRLAEERKRAREKLKERYGYAIVDGRKIELQNWIVEPAGIFMSKGRNPLRGRWKKAVDRSEITLNLSEVPDDLDKGWKSIVWKSDCMWIACWRNPLNGKMKYVWFSPKSDIRQEREREKWDKAVELEKKIKEVESHVNRNLGSREILRRKVATVVYLIKETGMRVGDERIAGETGTIGCTTLKAENVTLKEDTVVLDFIGKDYVHWHREINLPKKVLKNIIEFIGKAKDRPIFDGIDSGRVSKFLQEVVPHVSAKTFRTMIAGQTFKKAFKETKKDFGKNEFENIVRFKYINLAVAKRLNHKRKIPDKFEERLRKKELKVKDRELKIEKILKEIEKASEKRRKVLERRLEKARLEYRRALLELKLYRDTAEWNLNTSLSSYIDPRLVIEYARKYKVPIERIYSKSLREKFSWAIK